MTDEQKLKKYDEVVKQVDLYLEGALMSEEAFNQIILITKDSQ